MLVFSAADFEDFLVPRPGHAARHGKRAKSSDSPSRGASVAVSLACDIQRDNRAGADVYEEVTARPFDGLHCVL